MPPYFKNIIDNELKLAFLYYDEMISARTSSTTKISNLLINIIEKLLSYQTKVSCSPLTEKIITFLKDNKYGKITLKDIENLTFFSSEYCEKIFKKDTGKTILKYFNTLKIEKAKELIIVGELSLSEISEKLGFEDYNYFSRLFSKIIGCSPKNYLNKWIKQIY